MPVPGRVVQSAIQAKRRCGSAYLTKSGDTAPNDARESVFPANTDAEQARYAMA